MKLVLTSRSELEAYITAHLETFGYDEMRDWLYDYALNHLMDEQACQLYSSIMTAY